MVALLRGIHPRIDKDRPSLQFSAYNHTEHRIQRVETIVVGKADHTQPWRRQQTKYVLICTTKDIPILICTFKIKDIEAEMAKTQKNKATSYHLGMALKNWKTYCSMFICYRAIEGEACKAQARTSYPSVKWRGWWL